MPAPAPKTILLVDDDYEIVESMRTVLEGKGYRVLVARDGNAGLTVAERENPDLIVLADTVCCGEKPSTVAARPGWDRISAVRTGSIVRVHDSIASRWGPRLVDFFRAMSSAIARLRQ